jgi:hypothetical protein
MDESTIQFMLKSNYISRIKPTNPLREDEYESRVLLPKMNQSIGNLRQLDLDNDISITFRFIYRMSRFFIAVKVWVDESDDITNPKIKENEAEILKQMDLQIDKIIDTINDANVTFISFENAEDDTYYKIFENRIYGFIYDLEKDTFAEPPKVIKTPIKVELVQKN